MLPPRNTDTLSESTHTPFLAGVVDPAPLREGVGLRVLEVAEPCRVVAAAGERRVALGVERAEVAAPREPGSELPDDVRGDVPTAERAGHPGLDGAVPGRARPGAGDERAAVVDDLGAEGAVRVPPDPKVAVHGVDRPLVGVPRVGVVVQDERDVDDDLRPTSRRGALGGTELARVQVGRPRRECFAGQCEAEDRRCEEEESSHGSSWSAGRSDVAERR